MRGRLSILGFSICLAAACSDGGTNKDAGPDKGTDGTITCTQVLPESFLKSTTLEKGCYLAKKTPDVAPGAVLTLQPGVTIIFSKDVGLEFQESETLHAVGTAAEPILLTGAEKQRGYWRGLIFDETNSGENELAYVTVEYGGSTTATNDPDAGAIKLTSDSTPVKLSLTHSTLRESGAWGLWAPASAQLTFSANTLTKNSRGPASLDSDIIGQIDGATTYKGNDDDHILVRANRITKAAKWPAIDVHYYVLGEIHVDAEWTVAAPATFDMAEKSRISVSGDTAALIAEGTQDKPIKFAGEKNVRGFWSGLVFINAGNAKNSLAYVTVEYGGSNWEGDDDGDVTLAGTGSPVSVKLSHCTLQQSAHYGLSLYHKATMPVFEANTITRNMVGAVIADSEVVHLLTPASTYTGNDVDQVVVTANTIPGAVTWSNIGIPYYVDGSELKPYKVWTLAAGVKLNMGQDSHIYVAGDEAAMKAVGTAAAPIVITGLTKTKGYWFGIQFDNTNNTNNVLDYVTVEYAGGGGYSGNKAEVMATCDIHGDKLAITHSTFQHSALAGVYLAKCVGANSDIDTSNTFADNTGDVVREP
jgi:hypothetical protein